MASEDFNSALPAPAHPMAKPGYGKRSAPDQLPRNQGNFSHLPPREAYIASYLDRLPDGAAIDMKTLAKELPFGQMAVGTALHALSAAGHLRRIRVPLGERLTQWVFRTYFSRTARDNAWWKRLLEGRIQAEEVQPEEFRAEEPVPTPPARSEAYQTLARLGRTDARMALSAAECAALEGLAAQWLANGATHELLLGAMTAGLPPQVHAPGAFARRRLTDKMPAPLPVRTVSVAPVLPARRALMECTECGVPGMPDALPGGLCRGCRKVPGPVDPYLLPPQEVRRRVAELRAVNSSGYRSGTGTPTVEACLP
ncbi:hypothetical protein NLX86_13225 [Streptomyces sp. A3M-1-3]|uniref:hypothetical protein n=1 Tax=Streptomyces sp. A3M-1-3 TaxID=2962044 RepID=UPI0020B7DAC2|nr:hypothetical protein [Streptomyces sp. A3M-1-3]MCP3819041.1 hypothetical protein [Streptomyces sp. A3M-1-3]